MNCDQIREMLTQHALGDLDDAARREVAEHLKTCDGCRAAARDVGPTLDLLRDALAAVSPAPRRLSAAHRARIFRGASGGRRSRVVWWVAGSHPTLAAVAALVVVGFLLAGLMMPALGRARGKARIMGTLGGALSEADFKKALPSATSPTTAARAPEDTSALYAGEAKEGGEVAGVNVTGLRALEPADATFGISAPSERGAAVSGREGEGPKEESSEQVEMPDPNMRKEDSDGLRDAGGFLVKSPIVMKGLYGSRSPGTRGSAVSGQGGGGGAENRPASPPPSSSVDMPQVNWAGPSGGIPADAPGKDVSGPGTVEGRVTADYFDSLSGARSDVRREAPLPPAAPAAAAARRRSAAPGPAAAPAPAKPAAPAQLPGALHYRANADAAEMNGRLGRGLAVLRESESSATELEDRGARGAEREGADVTRSVVGGKNEEMAKRGEDRKKMQRQAQEAALKQGVETERLGMLDDVREQDKIVALAAEALPEKQKGDEAKHETDGERARDAGTVKTTEPLAELPPGTGSQSSPLQKTAKPGTSGGRSSCDAGDSARGLTPLTAEEKPAARPRGEDETDGPKFRAVGVNAFVKASERPFSTFSIDVDTASYTLARGYMLQGRLPPAEAVRTEEFVNFFDYAYKPPETEAFRVYAQWAPSRFGRGLHLLAIGVKGRRLGREEQRPACLTFLVDTSGSMDKPDRLGLIKKSLRMLVERLGPLDLVAIVQYDSHARLILEHTPAARRDRILKAIDALQCGGSTNLEEGMRLAYRVAAARFAAGGENRVLLLSDGVANLGSVSAEDILKVVEGHRRQGIFLSVFGFGTGTYDDAMLETLANKGDGVYAFLDSDEEARRVFVEDLAATLNTIARDVKIQVEFNPKRTLRYRQIGYENRQLRKEDFRDDAVDAGEVGSGQSVTALYELEMAPSPRQRAAVAADEDGPIAVVRIRYRPAAGSGAAREIERPVTDADASRQFESAPAWFRLAACVAEFAEILRGSPFARGVEFQEVAAELRPVALDRRLDGRLGELLRVVESAGGMTR